MMNDLIMDMDQTTGGAQMENRQAQLTKEKSVEISSYANDRHSKEDKA